MKRKPTKCEAVKQGLVKIRGFATIGEYDKDGDPQYYCLGYVDRMSDELLEVCKECPDHVYKAQKEA